MADANYAIHLDATVLLSAIRKLRRIHKAHPKAVNRLIKSTDNMRTLFHVREGKTGGLLEMQPDSKLLRFFAKYA